MSQTVSILIDLRNSIVAALNAAPNGTFVLPFVAQSYYVPLYDLASPAAMTLKVGAVIHSRGRQLATRGKSRHKPVIGVGVQQRVASSSDPYIDSLMLLCDQIYSYLEKQPQGLNGLTAVSAPYEEPYFPQHLTEISTFTSVFELTYDGLIDTAGGA